jgi:hypothetical protein
MAERKPKRKTAKAKPRKTSAIRRSARKIEGTFARFTNTEGTERALVKPTKGFEPETDADRAKKLALKKGDPVVGEEYKRRGLRPLSQESEAPKSQLTSLTLSERSIGTPQEPRYCAVPNSLEVRRSFYSCFQKRCDNVESSRVNYITKSSSFGSLGSSAAVNCLRFAAFPTWRSSRSTSGRGRA